MASTSSSDRVCEGGCGGAAPVVSILGQEIPLRYCADCGERERALEDARERAAAADAALAAAGATPRLLAGSLDRTAADLSEQADACRRWLDGYRAGERANLWLTGAIGTGKTWLAWGVVRELALDAVARFYAVDEEFRGASPSRPALLVCWRDLLDGLRDEVGRPDGSAGSTYDRARRVPVLALDDLGAERPTQWALEQLAGLVQARYDAVLPTIVTSNYNSAELGGRLGHEDDDVGRRIVTRLVEGAAGVRLEGENRRRAA